jgi:Transcriptional regulators
MPPGAGQAKRLRGGAARGGVDGHGVGVLAGYERVLPRTRDKVLTAVTELGYVPSGAARDLAARRTGVLGLCFPDLDTEDGDAAYWYDEVIRGMERAARRSGYAVLIAASHHRDDSGLVLSIAGRCDGLVVLARTAPLAMIEHVATRIPVVLLATEESGGQAGPGHRLPGRGQRDRGVPGDGASGGRTRLRRHLLHRRAARLTGLGPQAGGVPAGRRRAPGDTRLPRRLHHRWRQADRRADHRRRAGAARAGVRQRPDRDRVMAALQHAGLSIPGDVAVTGFDGIRLGRHLRPSLTTVVQPMAALGDTAVAMLNDRIGGAAQPPQTLPRRTVELPVRLELRGSCGCAP